MLRRLELSNTPTYTRTTQHTLNAAKPQVEAFKVLPEGTVHFVSGTGRSTMPPIMATGAIDGLAFIGGSNAADDLIKQHPHPHRLKVFLQLEAKNMAVSTCT
jgi:glyceraldehyde-3-phosphate dehydrogenase (NADP+)